MVVETKAGLYVCACIWVIGWLCINVDFVDMFVAIVDTLLGEESGCHSHATLKQSGS